MSTNHSVNAAEVAIHSVTVFKGDRAQIVRVFSLDIKEGKNIVVVSNLPNCIDRNSVRVSGLGGSVALADVVCNIPIYHTFPLNDTQYALEQQKLALLDEKQIHLQEVDILVAYGNSSTHDKVTPSEIPEFLTTFREERRKRLAAVRELDDKLRALTEEQATSVEASKKGIAKAKVTISLIAAQDSKMSLRFTYLVSNAQWHPTYDLYALSTDMDSISLLYRARITQSTGEDWTDTQLTLSTTHAQSQQIPSLGVYTISRRPTFFFPAPAPPLPHNRLFGGYRDQAQRMPTPSMFGLPSSGVGENSGGGLFGQNIPHAAGGMFTALTASQQSTPAFGQSAQPSAPAFGQGSQPNQAVGRSVVSSAATGQTGGSFSAGLDTGLRPSTPRPSTPGRQPTPLFGPSMPTPNTSSALLESLRSDALRPAHAAGPFSDTNAFGSFGRSSGGTSNGPALVSQQTSAPVPADVGMSYDAVDDGGFDPHSLAPMMEGTMSVKSNTLSTSFTVQGKATVQSDGAVHVIPITSLTCVSTLRRVCVPRLSTNVYLQCRVENATDYKLLPGIMNVFLDEEYVSSSLIKGTEVDGDFECALGVDPALRVVYERRRVSKTATEATHPYGGADKSVTRCTARTIIHNKTGDLLKSLVVYDSLPVVSSGADDDKDQFKVNIRKPEGLVDASIDELVDVRDNVTSSGVDKKGLAGAKRKIRWIKGNGGQGGVQGKYEWIVDVLPGEELTLLVEWDVKSPESVKWEEMPSSA